jgi:hypothetical protein
MFPKVETKPIENLKESLGDLFKPENILAINYIITNRVYRLNINNEHLALLSKVEEKVIEDLSAIDFKPTQQMFENQCEDCDGCRLFNLYPWTDFQLKKENCTSPCVRPAVLNYEHDGVMTIIDGYSYWLFNSKRIEVRITKVKDKYRVVINGYNFEHNQFEVDSMKEVNRIFAYLAYIKYGGNYSNSYTSLEIRNMYNHDFYKHIMKTDDWRLDPYSFWVNKVESIREPRYEASKIVHEEFKDIIEKITFKKFMEDYYPNTSINELAKLCLIKNKNKV